MKRAGGQTEELAAIVGESGLDETAVRAVLRALASVVSRRERTEVRGLGVFTWRPFRGRLPDGTRFRTDRLWFKTQSIRRHYGNQ